MASILNVDTINNAAGTSAVTIDSSGNVAIPGHVMQVVQASGNTATYAGSAGSWLATDASITITPTSSSNKIYVMHSAGGLAEEGCNDAGLRMKRGSTVILSSTRYGYFTGSNGNWHGINWPMNYLDSPATTSATTYSMEIRRSNATGGLRHCDDAYWTMIAMEIAG